jgi:biotin carboxyl carrier protein
VKYCVTIDDREYEIELNGEEIRVNGRRLSAKLVAVPQTPLRQLVLDGSSRTYAMIRREADWIVLSRGESHAALVEDERTRQVRRMAGGAEQRDRGGVVVAPMPGMVIRVEVEIGQVVPQGGGVAVLEAMKMENEIRAPAGGVVSAIHITAGQAVDKGALLVELAPQA